MFSIKLILLDNLFSSKISGLISILILPTSDFFGKLELFLSSGNHCSILASYSNNSSKKIYKEPTNSYVCVCVCDYLSFSYYLIFEI